jgi:hypothetical protein
MYVKDMFEELRPTILKYDHLLESEKKIRIGGKIKKSEKVIRINFFFVKYFQVEKMN